jgi:hypothetical protein
VADPEPLDDAEPDPCLFPPSGGAEASELPTCGELEQAALTTKRSVVGRTELSISRGEPDRNALGTTGARPRPSSSE